MKTIPEREFDSLREVLPNYYQMIKANPLSLITRFYGLHRLTWHDKDDKKQTLYLVVIQNVFKFFKIGHMFDLKGSTAKRATLKVDQRPKDVRGVAMKDNDFAKHFERLTFMSEDDDLLES